MRRFLSGLSLLLLVTAVVTGGSAMARPKDPVVYQTMPQNRENTFFDITSLYHAQLGQSLNVERSMTWKQLQMGTSEVKLVKKLSTFADLVEGGYDEGWFEKHFSKFTVPADVTLEIWRQDSQEPIPDEIDLAEGFTQVYAATIRKRFTIGTRVNFRLGDGVTVTPGRYFVTLGLRFVNPRVFNLRFTGQENGTNTLGGYDHSHPVRPECANYTMTKDSHPGGQAYRPKSESRPEPPLWLAPFTTRFEVANTKVLMPCDMNGIYDPNAQIWNPGDVGMVFRGTRT